MQSGIPLPEAPNVSHRRTDEQDHRRPGVGYGLTGYDEGSHRAEAAREAVTMLQ